MLLLSWVKQVLKTGAMIAWVSYHIPIPPLPPSNLSHPTCKSVLSVCQTYSFQNSPQMQKKSQFCKNWVRGVKDKEEKFWKLLWSCECNSEAGHTWEEKNFQDDLRRGEGTVLQLRWAVPYLQGFLDWLQKSRLQNCLIECTCNKLTVRQFLHVLSL